VPGLSADDRCSLRSRAAAEDLAGTASTIRHWLLIEHPGPWGRDGLLDARLPEGVGLGLRDLEAQTGARVLLIRKPNGGRGFPDGVFCTAVDTRAAWRGWRVADRIDDVVDVDPRAREGFADPESGEPLFVTCTHGRRDPCCAERGRPLARAIDASAGNPAWESTHVGGDRFAGNLVAFPHGLVFGRVEPDEGAGIVEAYLDGRIGRLDRYRGRTSQPFAVQAADVALRRRLGLDRIDDVTPERFDAGPERVTVTLGTPSGSHDVELERSIGAPMRLTCHHLREEPARGWRVVAIDGERA
jgi:Sucrase/ferredoxin-like